jgi:hypothetical protein
MIAEGFRAASGWITLLLVLLVVVEGLGLVFWLMYAREVSFGDLVNRLMTALPSAPEKGVLSLARASLGLSVVRLFAVSVLSYGSIPVAVILPLLDGGSRKGDRMDLRKWMLHPDRAQELVLRSTGGDCL